MVTRTGSYIFELVPPAGCPRAAGAARIRCVASLLACCAGKRLRVSSAPHPVGFESRRMGSKKPATELATGFSDSVVPRLQEYSNDDDRRERGGLPHVAESGLKKLVNARLNCVIQRTEATLALLAVAVVAANDRSGERVDVGTSGRAAVSAKNLVDACLYGVVV